MIVKNSSASTLYQWFTHIYIKRWKLLDCSLDEPALAPADCIRFHRVILQASCDFRIALEFVWRAERGEVPEYRPW